LGGRRRRSERDVLVVELRGRSKTIVFVVEPSRSLGWRRRWSFRVVGGERVLVIDVELERTFGTGGRRENWSFGFFVSFVTVVGIVEGG